MLWTLVVLLLIAWAVLFGLHIAGGLIHIILVAAVILFLYNLFVGRRTVT